MIRLIICSLYVILPLFVSSVAFAQNTSLGSGEISGTLGKIECNALPDGKLQLQKAGKQRKLSRKKAIDIQRNNRKILKNLQKQIRTVSKSINQIRVRNDVGGFISQLKPRVKNKLARIEKRVEKLGLTDVDFGDEVGVNQLEDELAELRSLLEEQSSRNEEAMNFIRSCKGCASDALNKTRSSKRMKSCGCFMKVIPSVLEFRVSNYPGKPYLCTAAAFVSWSDADDAGATRWDISYDIGPVETRSQVASPPFDDVTTFDTLTFQVSGGNHWSRIGASGKQGGGNTPVDCGDLDERYRNVLSNPVVEVTVCPLE